MTRVVCLGIAVKDLVFEVDQLPREPQKVTARRLRVVHGGMAATASASIARLGGQAEYWGRVGDDADGLELIRGLEQAGVHPEVRRVPGGATPVAAIWVDPAGERMLAVVAGGLDEDASWLPMARLDDTQAVHVDFRWVAGAERLLLGARERSLPRVLDADAGSAQALQTLLPLADHVIFSERGLRSWRPERDLRAALMAAAAEHPGIVAVTRGELGSWFVVNGQWHEIPTPQVEAVDTNGAGDVFHGAYALALGQGADWMEAARYGSAAAAAKCQLGTGWACLPTHEQAMALRKGNAHATPSTR
ncbi:MAG: sugar kinase [Limnohabitans sp.]|nr:sugar kinase [Limnohabitans sp.]